MKTCLWNTGSLLGHKVKVTRNLFDPINMHTIMNILPWIDRKLQAGLTFAYLCIYIHTDRQTSRQTDRPRTTISSFILPVHKQSFYRQQPKCAKTY